MLTLMYHNILTEPACDLPVAGTQVTAETFREHMMRLRHDLLNPLEVHAQLMAGKMPKGVLVTLDDGALGVMEAGRILAELGTQGVAFICPGAIANGLWFYKLADALVRARVPRLIFRQFDLVLRGHSNTLAAYRLLSRFLFELSPESRDDSLGEIIEALHVSSSAPIAALATLDEGTLEQAKATGGLIFANHTWSHPSLLGLSQEELVREIEDAALWLSSSELPTVPWFAFPRGAHDSRVRSIVSRYCPISFGANAYENGTGVLPRTYICGLDSKQMRFAMKTMWSGRVGAMVSRELNRLSVR